MSDRAHYRLIPKALPVCDCDDTGSLAVGSEGRGRYHWVFCRRCMARGRNFTQFELVSLLATAEAVPEDSRTPEEAEDD